MCMFVIYVFNIFMFVLKFHAHRYIIIIHCNHTCEKYIFKKQIYFARKDHFSFFCHVITISPIWLKLSFFLYLSLVFSKITSNVFLVLQFHLFPKISPLICRFFLFAFNMKHQNYSASKFRSSRPEVLCKKGIFRNFTKFTGKHTRPRDSFLKL